MQCLHTTTTSSRVTQKETKFSNFIDVPKIRNCSEVGED